MQSNKLGDLVTITIGRTPSRSDSDYWDKTKESKNVWLSIADMLNVDGRTINDSKEYITDDAAGNFSVVPKGTLLVSFKLTLGRLAFAGRDLRTNEAIAALRNDESKVLNEYLYYYLSHFNWMGYAAADKKVKGFTLNKAKLHEINIYYPSSLLEQQSIIAKLDSAFEKIDQVILLNERNLKDARKLWKSTLSEIFDKQYDAWNRDIIGELIEVTSSKRIYKSEYVKAGIPFYRTREIKELANGLLPSTELFIGDARYHEIKSKFGVPVVGDILLTAIGTIGEVYVIPDNKTFYFKDGNVLWLKESKFLDSYYLSYAIKNFINELELMANGSAYNALPINKLKSYAISYPSLEQQKNIVKDITDKEIYIRKLESAYRIKAGYFESLKRSILNQIFSESAVK